MALIPGTLSFEKENLRDKPRKEAVNTQPFYQDTTKMPQDDRRWVEDATKMPPRCHQDGPKTTEDAPKMTPRGIFAAEPAREAESKSEHFARVLEG